MIPDALLIAAFPELQGPVKILVILIDENFGHYFLVIL